MSPKIISCNRSFKEQIKKTHLDESQIHDTIQLAVKNDTPPPSPPTELFHHPWAPPLVCLDNKSQEKESKDKWDLDAMGMATELEWDISYSEMSLDRKIILENPNLREQVQKDEKELSEEYKKITPKEFRYCEKKVYRQCLKSGKTSKIFTACLAISFTTYHAK
jgi:hypothetical protein